MIVRITHRFTKTLAKLDPKSRKAVKKAMELLLENPHHPSLRTRNMRGYEDVFEVSASMDIRITFHYEKPDTIVLRNVGHHDDALSNP